VTNKDFTFYWFDYETFGLSPFWDKPAQFAGQRTNADLEPIGEPVVFYCKPPSDYLPHPESCRVTGLRPDHIAEHGDIEPEFIAKVVAQLGYPGTCSVGYNNIRFDDEFTRHTLFRNFHDAYEYEWKDGNSRWDLLDVVRLTRALRPDGIEWPVLEDGSPSNRLELLSQANGIEHTHAHDALSDVEATIGMAQLIKEKQPKLFNYAFTHRDKKSVAAILNYKTRQPCIHVSGMIPGENGHTSIVIPITRHPVNQNGVIVLDLRTDPNELFELDSESIAKRVFTKKGEMDESDRLHLRTIQINKCPVLVPMGTLRPDDAQRLGIDLPLQKKRAIAFEQQITDGFAETIRQAMTREFEPGPDDVDGSIYSGNFFSSADKQRFAEIRKSDPGQLDKFEGLCDDKRVDELLIRYRARNYPDTLNENERADWQGHIKERLRDETAPWTSAQQFQEIMSDQEWNENENELRESLETHAKNILSGI